MRLRLSREIGGCEGGGMVMVVMVMYTLLFPGPLIRLVLFFVLFGVCGVFYGSSNFFLLFFLSLSFRFGVYVYQSIHYQSVFFNITFLDVVAYFDLFFGLEDVICLLNIYRY